MTWHWLIRGFGVIIALWIVGGVVFMVAVAVTEARWFRNRRARPTLDQRAVTEYAEYLATHPEERDWLAGRDAGRPK